MNKGIIFQYELRRLLLSKEYLLLLIAILTYSVAMLRSTVMYGTNYTAPFSELTFGTYCGTLAPMLFLLLLALCARQLKKSERGAEAIISASPMPIHTYRLIRSCSILCAYLIVVLLPVILCFAYYLLVFDYTGFSALTWLYAVTIVPSSLLLMGLALNIGKRYTAVVYVLLAIVLIISVFDLSLPPFMDLLGSSMTLPAAHGAQGFEFTSSILVGRAAFLVIGILLITISCRSKK